VRDHADEVVSPLPNAGTSEADRRRLIGGNDVGETITVQRISNELR